jgi:hypothetical protein
MPSRKGRGRFCSLPCKVEWTKGKHFSPDTEIKVGSHINKGRVFSEEHKQKLSSAKLGKDTWNKGTVGMMPDPWNKGTAKPRVLKGYRFGERHPNWKGDEVGYSAIHDWIERTLGKPERCADCNISGTSIRYNWHNISGLYMRNIDDWVRLCTKCHTHIHKNWEKRWQPEI